MNEERMQCRNSMIHLSKLLISGNFHEVNKVISDLNPENDSLRVFTSVILCSFTYRAKLKNWNSKVEEFYLFHRNTENIDKWFVGLRGI